MTVLVLGRFGQVASHLRALLPDAWFWGRATLDLESSTEVAATIIDRKPSCIVNAAAYTAVDRAESEPLAAWAVNATAVAEVARAATVLDVPLVHLSTDYVFDGTSREPYRVGDAVNPLGTYGRTKLAGELAVATLCAKHWILRASWVFSEHGTNFVRTMLRLAAERDALGVVADQHGVPSYASDLAAVIAALVARKSESPLDYGLYHAVGGVPTTWFDFAREIFALAEARGLIARRPTVSPITTADYPTAARRPANSVLAPSPALIEATGVTLDWKRGLEVALDRLATAARSA